MKKPSIMPLFYFLAAVTVIAVIAVKIADYVHPEPTTCNPRLAFTDKPVKNRHCEIHAGPEVVVEIEKPSEPSDPEPTNPDVADFNQMV